VPAGSAVLVAGGAGIIAALAERGFRRSALLDDGPVAVVRVRADVDWRQLAEGSYAVQAELLWVPQYRPDHPDRARDRAR
jgi:hypothetical protein